MSVDQRRGDQEREYRKRRRTFARSLEASPATAQVEAEGEDNRVTSEPPLARRVSISQDNLPTSDDNNPTAEVTEQSQMGDDGDMERDGTQDGVDPTDWENELSGDEGDDIEKDEERVDTSEDVRKRTMEIAHMVARGNAKKKMNEAGFTMICGEVRKKVKSLT